MIDASLSFLQDNTDSIVEQWKSVHSHVLAYTDDRVLQLLISIDDRIPTLYDDLANFDLMTVSLAREHKDQFTQWYLLLNNRYLSTDEDFLFVTSHMDKVPYEKREDLSERFLHLFDQVEFETREESKYYMGT